MGKRKVMIWILAIIVLAAVLGVWLFLGNIEKNKDYLSRAMVSKEVVLAMISRQACEEFSNSGDLISNFPLEQQGAWYVKYMDYLYENGFLSADITNPSSKSAMSWFTVGEVKSLLEAMEFDKELIRQLLDKQKTDQPIHKEAWYKIYDIIRSKYDLNEDIKEQELIVYGTPANIIEAKAWMVYTNYGVFGFEGIGLDSYIDRSVKVLTRDGEIVALLGMVSDTVVYENVWIKAASGTTLNIFYMGMNREFILEGLEEKDGESVSGVLGDLYIEKGKMTKLRLKQEKITGKVLAVSETEIEIEGYGKILLSDNFKVYKLYGELTSQNLSDVLVGYGLQEFIVAEGKICAALTTRAFDAQTIRVLLMDSGFQSIYHSKIVISSSLDIILSYGEHEEHIAAGTPIEIYPEDERFIEGRIRFQAVDEKGELTISNLERGYGIPSYNGSLELTKEDEGIVMVNELFLEDYLTKVVPSEMPASYGLEALKAQAVCARSYAYRQIKGNSYSKYGAHVDDSTKFQVYNNIVAHPRSTQAVVETYGKVAVRDDTVINAYYFSTSCGHTTDGTIWGGDVSGYPYIGGTMLRNERTQLDLSQEENFKNFIMDKEFSTFDTPSVWFRWETEITISQLEGMFEGIGSVTGMSIDGRGKGGIAAQITISGTDGSKLITGQSDIRNQLGNKELTITKKDGNTVTGWGSLPSAFFCLEPVEADGVLLAYHIYGGGYGHGAGMSQSAAKTMAEQGMNWEEILKFFYDGIELKDLTEVDS